MDKGRIARWAAAIFVGWYVFTQPEAAGDTVDKLFGFLETAGTSLAAFVNSIG